MDYSIKKNRDNIVALLLTVAKNNDQEGLSKQIKKLINTEFSVGYFLENNIICRLQIRYSSTDDLTNEAYEYTV